MTRCRCWIIPIDWDGPNQNAAKPGQTESPVEQATGVENPTAHKHQDPKPLDRDVPLKSGEVWTIPIDGAGWSDG